MCISALSILTTDHLTRGATEKSIIKTNPCHLGLCLILANFCTIYFIIILKHLCMDCETQCKLTACNLVTIFFRKKKGKTK